MRLRNNNLARITNENLGYRFFNVIWIWLIYFGFNISEVIFISHTKTDKPLVEGIATTLASVYGQQNVFYDSWSIQPGDGIIDKMNEALSKCKFFFFFVSKQSLTSKMVSLEWQNALLKATKNECKLIPVKLDDCFMPPILLQSLYIDLFGQGPEVATRQMIDVINGKNIFQYNQNQGYQNIRGYVSQIGNSIQIEFRAETYMEPHSKYLILLENDEVEWSISGITYQPRFVKNQNVGGKIVNVLAVSRADATSPSFPFIVKLTPKNNAQIRLNGLMRAISTEEYRDIPIILNDSAK